MRGYLFRHAKYEARLLIRSEHISSIDNYYIYKKWVREMVEGDKSISNHMNNTITRISVGLESGVATPTHS